MIDAYGSLTIAARRACVSEEFIRQAILRGDIAAIPVSDGRRYLVRLRDALTLRSAPEPPSPPAWGLVAGIVAISGALATLITGSIVSIWRLYTL